MNTPNPGTPRFFGPVPGAPRVETQAYRFPPARPDAPSAVDCTEAQLLDLAADASESRTELLALVSSPDHVRRICALLKQTHRLYLAELEERNRVAVLHAAASNQTSWALGLHRQASAENLVLRRRLDPGPRETGTLRTAFDSAARAVTGMSAEQLSAELDRQVAAAQLDEDETVVIAIPTGGGR